MFDNVLLFVDSTSDLENLSAKNKIYSRYIRNKCKLTDLNVVNSFISITVTAKAIRKPIIII